jgi:hypothetical protein
LPTIYLYLSYENFKKVSDAAEARKIAIKDFIKEAAIKACQETPK